MSAALKLGEEDAAMVAKLREELKKAWVALKASNEKVPRPTVCTPNSSTEALQILASEIACKQCPPIFKERLARPQLLGPRLLQPQECKEPPLPLTAAALQEAAAMEAEKSFKRENSHLMALVGAGASTSAGDDSAVAALQKSFNELMQEREQQVLTQFCMSSAHKIPTETSFFCTCLRQSSDAPGRLTAACMKY